MITIFANRNGKNATVSKSVLFTVTPINIYIYIYRSPYVLLYKITIFQYRCETMKKKRNCESETCVTCVCSKTAHETVQCTAPRRTRESPASFSRVIADACTHHLRVLSERTTIYIARESVV